MMTTSAVSSTALYATPEAEFEPLDKRSDWLKLRDDLKSYYSEMLQKSENIKKDG